MVWIVGVLIGLVTAASASQGVIEARFDHLRADVAARRPYSKLHKYFSKRFVDERSSIFDYEFLDAVVGFDLNGLMRVETVQGNKGCLAFARPYPAFAEGDWIELDELSFERIRGVWVITAASHSISPVHNRVASKYLCNTLGWPR